MHLGVPLLLVFGLWFHIQRIARAAMFPPRPMALGVATALLALALAVPVHSHAPADMAVAPTGLALDWFLLFVHPLADASSPQLVWALLSAALALLFVLPFLPQPAAAPVAVVDAANCNGCRRCFDDCPYAAVTMVPHPIRRTRQMAQVDADLCASCGICVGACPSSTPFRSVAELVTGIDMPSAPIGALRRRLRRPGRARRRAQQDRRVRLRPRRRCDGARRPRCAAAFSLMCSAQLPPSFVEYALRDGAAGVVVSGCRRRCEFRLGQRWTAERLQGTREPHLRRPRCRASAWTTAWADAGETGRVQTALDSHCASNWPPASRRRPPTTRRSPAPRCKPMSERQNTSVLAWAGQALLYGVFALVIGVFSSWPTYDYLQPDQALIKLSFNHQGKPVSDCRDATAEELAKLPRNMRAPKVCPRERSPITVELEVDGATALRQRRRTVRPVARRRIDVLPPDGGRRRHAPHKLVRLKDDVRSQGFDYQREADVTLKPAQILVIDFDPGKGGITLQ